jgi:TRAP-type C4-dicarboxylate transport system permease small subunit
MTKILRKKLLLTFCLVSLVILAWTKIADNYSENYTSDALKSTAITYGVARAMNATVSVIQGTEVLATPAGIGVSFSVGEVLDPVNDLIERFSFIVMLSMASLALQKLLIGIGASVGFNALLLMAVTWYLVHLWFFHPSKIRNLALRFIYVVLYIRFALVAVIGANYAVDTFFLGEVRQTTEHSLMINQENMDTLATQLSNEKLSSPTEEPGMFDSISSAWNSIQSGFTSATTKVDKLKEAAESSINNIIDLIVVFILQTIILPLLFIWGFYRGLRFLILSSNFKQIPADHL